MVYPQFIYKQIPGDSYPGEAIEDEVPYDGSRGDPEIGQYRIPDHDSMNMANIEIWRGLIPGMHPDFGWVYDDEFTDAKDRYSQAIGHEKALESRCSEMTRRLKNTRAWERRNVAVPPDEWKQIRKDTQFTEQQLQTAQKEWDWAKMDVDTAMTRVLKAFPALLKKCHNDLTKGRREAWRERRRQEWDSPTNRAAKRHFEAERKAFWQRFYAEQDAELEGKAGRRRYRGARAASAERRRRDEDEVEEAFRQGFEARWGAGTYDSYGRRVPPSLTKSGRRRSTTPPRNARGGRSRTPPLRSRRPSNGVPYAQQAQIWLKACSTAFNNHETMTSFPLPPPRECENAICGHTEDLRKLEACPCNIRDCFGRLSERELRNARTHLHPDKFGRCREDLSDEFKEIATELFVIVDAMWRERR